MTTILFILFAIFIVAGWATAEWNYRTEKEKLQKNNRQTLFLKQKTEKLESVMEHQNLKIAELNEAYEYSRKTSEKARTLESQNKGLLEENERFAASIDWLEKKVKHREYSGNSLARVIKAHLEHAFPSDQMREQKQTEESKEAFRRIKKSMNE